jgi:alpha-beta hydrolase superfamily lysophospholipase
MNDFPEFIKAKENHIGINQQNTEDIDVYYFEGIDGVKIYYRKFLPTVEPRAILLIIQGSGGGKLDDYYHFAKKLNFKGYAVIKVDERGTGCSEGARGDIKNYDTVINDYINLVDKLTIENKGKNLFLLGHSFGGVVATRLSFELKDKVSGLVLLNPMFGYSKEYGPSVWDIVFFIYCMVFQSSKAVYNIAGDLNRIKYLPDKEEASKNSIDPRIVKNFSVRYLMTTKKIIDQSEYYTKYNNIPLLLIRGERDDFVDKEKTAKIFKMWPHVNKHEVIIENAGHGVYTVNLTTKEVIGWLEFLV